MNLLTNLYAIHSKSGSEKKMKKFIRKYVSENIPDTTVSYDNGGNMYLVKGDSDTYPCVVAHLDQVQNIHDKDFEVIQSSDTIFAFSSSERRMNGLGADDKNGIWVALKCLEKYDAIKVAFFVGEEVGCVGSSKADMSFFKDCRFVIEPDRRGASDLITNISYTEIASAEFLQDSNYRDFGYVPTSGLMTDVLELVENGVGISCINLSCGYYNPHTDHETTSWKDLNNCLSFVEYIIENCTKVYVKEYVADYHNDMVIFKATDYNYIENYVLDMLYENICRGISVNDIWDAVSADCETFGFEKNDFDSLALDVYSEICGGWEDNGDDLFPRT